MNNLKTPEAQDIIIVGVSGDLCRRKLIPALYNLWRADLLPSEGRIIGMARSPLDTKQLRELAHTAVKQYSRTGIDEESWSDFAKRMTFVRLEEGSFEQVKSKYPNRIVYLAVPPSAVENVVDGYYKAWL